MKYLSIASFFILLGCGSELATPTRTHRTVLLAFGPEFSIGNTEANPSTPFLQQSPDGRLFAVWTEDHENPWPHGKHSGGGEHMKGDRAPSSMRNAFIAASNDGGKTWSSPKRSPKS